MRFLGFVLRAALGTALDRLPRTLDVFMLAETYSEVGRVIFSKIKGK